MKHQIPDTVYSQLSASGKQLLPLILDDHFSYEFTDFEKEVLIQILTNQSEYEIANTLQVPISIVRTTAHSIFSKLDGDSEASGRRVPRKPNPGGNSFSAEEPLEQTDSVKIIDILVSK